MDKKSLSAGTGHTPLSTDLNTRFHDGKHAEIRPEGQDRV
jgi:hypothetical protein